MKKDILHRDDVTRLVTDFYDRVVKDTLLAPFFVHTDFEAHMPRMIDFWCFTILDEGSFRGNIFDKHAPLPLQDVHFEKWLQIFETTLYDHFEGVNADKALQRAKLIGYTFASKMKAQQNPEQ